MYLTVYRFCEVGKHHLAGTYKLTGISFIDHEMEVTRLFDKF
jgi:hypothetical protein